jgi:hypothetical protein
MPGQRSDSSAGIRAETFLLMRRQGDRFSGHPTDICVVMRRDPGPRQPAGIAPGQTMAPTNPRRPDARDERAFELWFGSRPPGPVAIGRSAATIAIQCSRV